MVGYTENVREAGVGDKNNKNKHLENSLNYYHAHNPNTETKPSTAIVNFGANISLYTPITPLQNIKSTTFIMSALPSREKIKASTQVNTILPGIYNHTRKMYISPTSGWVNFHTPSIRDVLQVNIFMQELYSKP